MKSDNRAVTFEDLKQMEGRLFKGMAEVVQDILTNVVTKPEFEERMDQMVTKSDFEARMDQMVTKYEFKEHRQETSERFDKIERKIVTKGDISDMVGELQSMREQLVIVLHHYERTQMDVGRIKAKLALA